eukprot:TRINITY_DN8412_c0_g1_i2.p1 TRINITY_DN8412_c0_g1~~TRINITY_DN8412_c0_g1_i2.p1  ORF type:complete len:751 (+),score=140.30 TRINITY_DN8412_c0_g1_i2:62-2314(+)
MAAAAAPARVAGEEHGVLGVDPIEACADIGESMQHFYVNHSVEDIYKRCDSVCTPEELRKCREIVLSLCSKDPLPAGEAELHKAMGPLRKRHKIVPKKSQMLYAYNRLLASGELPEPVPIIRSLLVQKAMKSQSGILSVTVLTSPYPSVPGQAGPPQRFSCKWDCHYCPNQPGQPRSYLRDEPAVRRANQNRFDPVLQFTDRCAVLQQNGHPVDKVELLVLGGTWHSYPLAYQEGFVRDLFYAANTFGKRGAARRPAKSLAEEQEENESAACKIIGLTLETRPDCIDADELRRLRRYGCTRVQLGVQHVDEAILKHVNRGHGCDAVVDALRLLKDSCYKIDVHLMPNLPGSSVETDRQMFRQVTEDEWFQADQWKIYPCEVTPWTKIKEWYDDGLYKPYPEDELLDLLADVKSKVKPWVRLNRVIRDIPDTYIRGGLECTNLREHILALMRSRGQRCRCIRCREVGDLGAWRQSEGSEKTAGRSVGGRQNRDGILSQRIARELAPTASLVVRSYRGSGAKEHFISYETEDERLFGFCRLRISDRKSFPDGLFPELNGLGLVRELHVYGQLIATSASGASANKGETQHFGFGTLLMMQAERMAWDAGKRGIAVISGIGTRNYYRRLGYEVHPGDGGFMIKYLSKRPPKPPAVGNRMIGGRWKLQLRKLRPYAPQMCGGVGALVLAAVAACWENSDGQLVVQNLWQQVPPALQAFIMLATLTIGFWAVLAVLPGDWQEPAKPPRPPSLERKR